MATLRPKLPVAFALAFAACGGAPPPPLKLAWRFADGRDCATSGVSTVTVGFDCDGCQPLPFACPQGDATTPGPPSVTITPPSTATRLNVSATSPAGSELYKGTLSLTPPLPTPAIVTLVFTAGQ